MPHIPLKLVILTILTVWSLQFAQAADPAPAVANPAEKTVPPYGFSLLPKAFQKHPVLAISIITEMTDEGRKLTPPSQENPTYCYLFSSGYHQEGYEAAQEGAVPKDSFEKLVQKSLASAGYLPGNKEHPAAQVLFLVWGVHVKLRQNAVETEQGGEDDLGHHNLLSRAALVGGAAFEKDLAKAIQEQAVGGWENASVIDPVYRFTNRDALTRNLMEQVLDDCYYVVISAYDGAALARGEKKLLWRTKMSTPAQGVSLVETTPALVASGRPFFGREMAQASIVGKRITRGGHVELGPLEFKGYIDKPSEPETSPASK